MGKREVARIFAGELLGDHARVARGSHPDLYVLEPLGEQIRIDDVRELRRDLHMRPFEADRRVYLVFGADSLNEDAADALLKDLEEPPPYAVVVLVAERLGPLPETIRSRCQLVPFKRLSEPALREAIAKRARRARRGRDRDARAHRRRQARTRAPAPRSGRGAPAGRADPRRARGLHRRGLRHCAPRPTRSSPASPTAATEAKEAAEARLETMELTGREAEQYARRAQRGAEREELLALLEELEWWYRDLVVVAAGADGAVVHVDHLAELRADATHERLLGCERACELVRAAWRQAEELQVSTPLALEALLIRLRGELAGGSLAHTLSSR